MVMQDKPHEESPVELQGQNRLVISEYYSSTNISVFLMSYPMPVFANYLTPRTGFQSLIMLV